MKLMVEPEHAGNSVNCPGCGTKLTVPAAPKDDGKGPASTTAGRAGWKESDPANANPWMALLIGVGVFAALYLPALAFPKSFYYLILYQRSWVNFVETICFGWGVGFLVLKFLKFKHQRNAMLLDVVPQNLGREINKSNIHVFIAHVYSLPVKLRDSMMVNRIRKALELFETRQVNGDVATMMANQSNIDGARIGGSFTMLRVFVWVIPILGFVGTVLGLSVAIGYFQSVMTASKDVTGLMASLGNVTGGLSTAFDTTLLALIYAILLSLPMSSLQKIEEDLLNHVDAYCNEILLPRLNDGSNTAGGDMGALADVLTSSLTRAHTQFLTGLDGASKLIREQSDGMERRASENQKVVQESFTKAVSSFQENAAKTLGDLGKTAGQSMESLSGTLQKAADHVASLEKVAATQQAQIEASVKQTLGKLQEDSSKVIAEAMKGAITETSRAIEGTFKPAVQQVTILGEAVKATAQHVATLEKHASEHQAVVQKALQEAISRVQQDSSKLLAESIKASADQSSKAMEEVMKPAVTQLAAIGETAKKAVEESAALQRQSREQHAAAQQSFMETTTKLQRDLSKTLEDAAKPVTQHFGGLAESLKTAVSAVSALEKQTREQQVAAERTATEQQAKAERAAADAATQWQRESAKALEDALRPAAVQLAALAGFVKTAADSSQALEKQSREQQATVLRTAQEAAAQLQRESAKALEDALRPAATQLAALAGFVKSAADSSVALEKQAREQQVNAERAALEQQAKAERAAQESAAQLQRESAKGLEEALRPAAVQLAALAGIIKTAAENSQTLEKQSRDQQTATLRAAQESAAQLQREMAKALDEALRPAATQLTALASGVKTATDATVALERQSREQQAAADRAMQEAVSRLQRDSVRGFEEALRPAAVQLGTLGESVKAAVTQLATQDRTAREQQVAAQRAMEETAAKLQRDAAKSLEDTLRPVVAQLGSLAENIRGVSEHVGSLDRQAREGQEATRRGVEENLARLQRDSIKGLEEALRPAAQHLATLGETVRAATQQLSGLDRHAQEHQATVAKAVEGSVGKLQQDASRAVEEVMRGAATQLASLQQGIAALNQTLTELNGKQVIVQQAKSSGVFSRMLGKG